MAVEVTAHGIDGDFNNVRFFRRIGQVSRKGRKHFSVFFRLFAFRDVVKTIHYARDFPGVIPERDNIDHDCNA